MAKKRVTLNVASPEQDWQAESDLRTMLECEVIEKDPKRLAAVQKLAKSKLLPLAGIAAEGKDDS